MERRRLGNTGLEVGALGFGAAEIGYEKMTDQALDALFAAAFEVGINLIDTAAMYSDSEEKVGRALQGRRSRCVLSTKCGRHPPRGRSLPELAAKIPWYVRRWMRRVDDHEPLDWQPRVLEWNIEQSLRRLGVDGVDVILLHSCSEATLRRGEVIEVLQRARKAGKARFIGYSGDGAAALHAVQCRQFDVLETSINIADQEALTLTLPLAIQQGMGVIAKRPLANGLWKSDRRPALAQDQAYWDRLNQLQYEFLQDGHAFAAALRFTLSVPGVHTAIVGTRSAAHLRQNAESVAEGALARERFDAIRERWTKIAQPDWVGQV